MYTYTFHSIDPITGKLSDCAFLGELELDEYMIWAESRFFVCQVVRNDGNKIIYQINADGKWEVYKKECSK